MNSEQELCPVEANSAWVLRVTYFYLYSGVMLSSLTPDTEIEDIRSALT